MNRCEDEAYLPDQQKVFQYAENTDVEKHDSDDQGGHGGAEDAQADQRVAGHPGAAECHQLNFQFDQLNEIVQQRSPGSRRDSA